MQGGIGIGLGKRLSFGRGRGSRPHFWAYILISVTFLFLEAVGVGVPKQIRSVAGDLVGPVLSVLKEPIHTLQAGIERLAGVSDIYIENQDLRAENDRMRQWRQAALQLSRENERLRRILKSPAREVKTAATGRVIGVGGGPFVRSIMVNIGRREGVRTNMPVIDENGTVGRLTQVGYWTSRVLLVSDINSRIPVRLETSNDLGIAVGQNETLLKLEFLSGGVTPSIGERVLTSGHGGVFPADIPVGRVSSVTQNIITVEPNATLSNLDYIKILDYQVPPVDIITPENKTVATDSETSGKNNE